MSSTLKERISAELDTQLNGVLASRPLLKLFPIVGNGLSRLQNATSWDDWIKQGLKTAGKPVEIFDSLRRQGFEHPEILNFIFKTVVGTPEAEKRIWADFSRNLYKLTPSGLHRALVLMAHSQIATTNYDVLLERAAHDVARYDRRYVLTPSSEPIESPYPPRGESLIISKLHGSLPPPQDGEPKDTDLDNWLNGEGYLKLVTTSAVYRKGALAGLDLLSPFFDLRAALERDDLLFLFLGTSLTPAELLVFRMLYSRWRTPQNLVVLQFDRPGDSNIRFEELGIKAIGISAGLAAVPLRRKIAYATLLELLKKIEISPERARQANEYIQIVYRDELAAERDVRQRVVSDIAPVVVGVGPLQGGRVIGLARAAEQEAFHSPGTATRGPDSSKPEVLISDASIGQIGNPVLVWDALRLPSAVVAEVGDDTVGDTVLGKLQRLTWTDFDGVLRVLPQKDLDHEASPGSATESYTCVTWFGFRTGFDSRRFGEKGSRLPTAEPWEHEFDKLRDVPIWYLTKVLAKEFTNWFEKRRIATTPLIVLETGEGGNPALERWVAERHGLVVASAKTALRWFEMKVAIPADEFGRYAQTAYLLKALQLQTASHDKAPGFATSNNLEMARGIVVTMGELGAISWERWNSEWPGPFWTFPTSLRISAQANFCNGSSLPLAEIRDALGCGDCARAGFTASLARSMGFQPGTGELPENSLSLAVAALNWFGVQKIRHFGMDTYTTFLSSNANRFWKRWTAAAASLERTENALVAFGSESFETFERRDALSDLAQTDGLLPLWLKRFDPSEKDGKEHIRRLIAKWTTDRGIVETR